MKTTISKTEIEGLFDQVKIELEKAVHKFHAYNSAHEGYAVIKEELDELWDEIKGDHNTKRLHEEAVQVASTAIRFIYDICLHSKNPQGLI